MTAPSLIVDQSAPAALRLADVPEPTAGPSQVVIDVRHASLNSHPEGWGGSPCSSLRTPVRT
jgi:NADPH:quinone reductase-like Zn-dependent oxidoreductase